MPKSKDTASYPASYFTLVDRGLELRQGESIEIAFPSTVEAKALQFDLNGFRTALMNEKDPRGRKSKMLLIRVIGPFLVITNRDFTNVTAAIDEALDRVGPPASALAAQAQVEAVMEAPKAKETFEEILRKGGLLSDEAIKTNVERQRERADPTEPEPGSYEEFMNRDHAGGDD